MHYYYRAESTAATICLKVTAGAKKNIIQGFVNLLDQKALKLSISTAPEDGKANIAILKMLAKTWGLKNSQLEIIRGHNNNIKLLSITDVSKDEMDTIISKYL